MNGYPVTTELDIVGDDGLTSLREAVTLANGHAGFDTITFASSLANKPVMLLSGQMTITNTVTIQGLGAGLTTVNGQNASRLFDITDAAGNVTFDGLTLTGGKTTLRREPGGGIRSNSSGELAIQNSTISGNSTTGPADPFEGGSDGGGIFARGTVTVTNSTISGNSTTSGEANGGGIFASGAVTVTNSTISGNFIAGQGDSGGGIFAEDAVSITSSTVSGNSARVSGVASSPLLR